MANIYAKEFIGIADVAVPTKRADARLVGHRPRGIVATKADGQALASGDRFYIGRKRMGETIRRIEVIASATLGSATLAIGTEATPAKYAAAQTMTTADKPVVLGPNAAGAAASPDVEFEHIWATVGGASIAAGTTLVFQMEIAGLN